MECLAIFFDKTNVQNTTGAIFSFSYFVFSVPDLAGSRQVVISQNRWNKISVPSFTSTPIMHFNSSLDASNFCLFCSFKVTCSGWSGMKSTGPQTEYRVLYTGKAELQASEYSDCGKIQRQKFCTMKCVFEVSSVLGGGWGAKFCKPPYFAI